MLDDRGSGSVLAVALLAVIVTFAVALALASGLAVAGRRGATAADLAALAAADSASGLLPGIPCETAARIAAANAARLRTCTIDGQIALVTLDLLGRWPVSSTARAGPPGSM